jgi:pimeloyl-ACP methyl ester carboxylesterase
MLVETRRCGRLYVEVRGEERPLVLWHSLLCNGAMWGPLPGQLARSWRVINIDGPGHGRSSRIDAPYTMDDCVDAAIDVLEACRAPSVVWCGLSWGGMVGMRLALRAPARVAGLVLIDTNADAESPHNLPKYWAMAMIARVLGPIPPLLDRLEPIFLSPHTRATQPALVQALRRTIASMDRASIWRAVDAVIFSRDDVRASLPQITAPTLVIVGADDVATPRARSEEIVARIRGARLVEIPRAGHLAAWEQPAAVLAALTPFLESLPHLTHA